METSQHSGGKDASVLVEQLPLCWHSIIITEICKQSTLRQHRPVTPFRGKTFLAFEDKLSKPLRT